MGTRSTSAWLGVLTKSARGRTWRRCSCWQTRQGCSLIQNRQSRVCSASFMRMGDKNMSTRVELARLSLNQMTTRQWNIREAVEGCTRAGIPAIGLWREKVAEFGLKESTQLVREAGISVSSLCRGGWFPAASASARQKRLDDNFRAVAEAAESGAQVLVLVAGQLPIGILPQRARWSPRPWSAVCPSPRNM